MAVSTPGAAFSVAIVGAGPKGLFALESILAHSRDTQKKLRVDLFDPQPPGHGAAYQPALPEYLRLNVDADIVSAWPQHRTNMSRPTWRVWAREAEPLIASERFPPRAAVGTYLEWSFHHMVSAAPGVKVRHVTSAVTGLRRDQGGKWHVVSGSELGPYDEVLLTVGHGSSWNGALARGTGRTISSVYPIQNLDVIPPHSRVRFRGAALTFIDGALVLTEGRGGRFEGQGANCRYVPSGSEPRALFPSSRSGAFLHAKPQIALPRDAAEAATKEWAAVGVGDVESLEEAIVGASHAILWELGAPVDRGRISETLRTGRDPAQTPRATDSGARAVAEFRNSVEVSRGEKLPGPAYALGRAWAIGYRTVVDRYPGPDMQARDWAMFMSLAATLERFAFGPPLVNAEKLLALIDSGLVVPDFITAELDEGGPYEHLVDAVLPPPGWRQIIDPLSDSLRASGDVWIPDGRRGVMITDDAQALGLRGATFGLSVLGRPTEDTVIGNDTLNRGLHDHPERWAARVMGRIEGTA
ncbi:FAD/NAD(P)-binding protein [Hoyosella subflava]|uniref:FAD-dependent urate hydroxylase HpyO/Asp monooxygenase CreE-like FAD/NAD(P)-binding domain-containing protein n=1 Tax=Hoyosella subflava (strain DSM 45089 / JCM 17490 / NBRC 109087 / DQS3-9A1) TaxID=443218 RepID=F6EK57_HOYSD|nr:FAD/NAD(P)-binding protein [Hoyosella subflava]AEF42598.1 hypothetical protein AS9A_4164 [Hoyosella subflava DQS3-9A1]